MRFKVAIAGAGIGGLTAAAYLARAGHEVEIFDKFDAPSPV
ncbi:MAG: FAD-dependent oxidoreductase, partial [Paracoccaceae bacterium]